MQINALLENIGKFLSALKWRGFLTITQNPQAIKMDLTIKIAHTNKISEQTKQSKKEKQFS